MDNQPETGRVSRMEGMLEDISKGMKSMQEEIAEMRRALEGHPAMGQPGVFPTLKEIETEKNDIQHRVSELEKRQSYMIERQTTIHERLDRVVKAVQQLKIKAAFIAGASGLGISAAYKFIF